MHSTHSRLKFDDDGKTCRLKNFSAPHFFTTAEAGNMSGKYGDPNEAEQNFTDTLKDPHSQIKNRVVILPKHSDKILFANRYFRESQEVECDGLFTWTPNTMLILRPADCFPILFTTADKRFIGLVHAGWKGTNLEIARKAVELAAKHYPIKPEEILAGIGPGICRRCYDDEKLAKDLLSDERRERWKKHISFGPVAGTQIDLLNFIMEQLQEAGVKKENITAAFECTCHSPYFFSHHRWNKNGQVGPDYRFAAVISKP